MLRAFVFVGVSDRIAIEQLGIMHILILTRECGTRNTPLHKLYSGYACLGGCYGLLHLNK